MVRLALGTLALIFVFPLGCGDGLSEDDAALRCDQEVAAKSACIPAGSAAYAECMSCFEQCGDLCKPQASCPATYACPAE